MHSPDGEETKLASLTDSAIDFKKSLSISLNRSSFWHDSCGGTNLEEGQERRFDDLRFVMIYLDTGRNAAHVDAP